MPVELINRLKAAANAQSGFDNVEYIASAFVDLAFHRITDPEVLAKLDINSFEDGVLSQARIPKAIEMRHRSPHFGHSFSGELYASGYYTYMWAGVLDNDGFFCVSRRSVTSTIRRSPVSCMNMSTRPEISGPQWKPISDSEDENRARSPYFVTVVWNQQTRTEVRSQSTKANLVP